MFCFLCSQMVWFFVFMGLQKCPLWCGQLVPKIKPECTSSYHKGNSRQPFHAHAMASKWTTATFPISFHLTLNNSSGQSLAMTPHIAPVWFKLRRDFFLFSSLAMTLTEPHCEISARVIHHFCFVLQHSYWHMLIAIRDVSGMQLSS